jgi:hypothetical protein
MDPSLDFLTVCIYKINRPGLELAAAVGASERLLLRVNPHDVLNQTGSGKKIEKNNSL